MAPAASTALTAVLILAGSIWTGGLVAIVVVARVTRQTLTPQDRIAFFRGLGRAYGKVGGAALVIALASGGLLIAARPWNDVLTVTVAIAACLVASTVAGVFQAQRMTRARLAALEQGDDPQQLRPLQQGARLAVGLRIAIAVFTLALLGLTAVLVG
jgi:uncharacterized membrane protein